MIDKIDFTPDAAKPPSNDQLGEISALARELIEKQQAVAKKESELKAAKEEQRIIEEDRLPTAMQAIGMKEFTLADGTTIEVKTEYHSNIAKAMRNAAFAWLRENNFDALIKRVIAVKFGKGEDTQADDFLALVKKQLPADTQLSDDESVHPQTLKAFVKECITEGTDLPRDVFGVHEINRAVLSSND